MHSYPRYFLLSYLLRDAGNYKTYGEALVENDIFISTAEAEGRLRSHLIDQAYFYPSNWKLPDLQEGQPEAGCSSWHEFLDLVPTLDVKGEKALPISDIFKALG